LLPALALEHADRAAILGIEYGPKQRGLLTAMTAHLDWIRFEAGKDFVFEFVIHESITSRSGRTVSYKVNIRSQKQYPAPRFRMERFVNPESKQASTMVGANRPTGIDFGKTRPPPWG
jgi:hypothetical protein